MSIFQIKILLIFSLLEIGCLQEFNETTTFPWNDELELNVTNENEATIESRAPSLTIPSWWHHHRIDLSSSPHNQKLDKVEYQQFLDSLSKMRQYRLENMARLDSYYRTLLNNKFQNDGKNFKWKEELQFRLYDFATGIQFEDEFDCDLNLLSDCESSLLRKIEIIEGRWVVFTMNRTEEDEVSSQLDVLNVCRSMDEEFTCLINFADKCENKMTWSTFSILKYIITQNNETIVSCKQKEIDWLGPPAGDNMDLYADDHVWIDHNGLSHHLAQSHGPCIPWINISLCSTKYFGPYFDFGHDHITTGSQCQAAYQFERCLKRYVYEHDSFCSLDEKEASLQIILGSIKWNLTNSANSIPQICYQLRQQWLRKKHIIGMQERAFIDHWDRSKRFAYELRLDLGSLLDPHCNYIVRKFDKPCEYRFEQRLRYLWLDEDLGKTVLDEETEVETVCCAISEFKKCVAIYVLIRCGKDSFRYFNYRVNIAQLEQCRPFVYESSTCVKRLDFEF